MTWMSIMEKDDLPALLNTKPQGGICAPAAGDKFRRIKEPGGTEAQQTKNSVVSSCEQASFLADNFAQCSIFATGLQAEFLV